MIGGIVDTTPRAITQEEQGLADQFDEIWRLFAGNT